MSFWHTFVGEMIHGLSMGLIGPDDHPVGGGNQVIHNTIPTECYTDPDFFIKNSQVCTGSSVSFVPPPPGTPTVTLPTDPPVCTVGCGSGTSGTGTGTPVSSVPEPSSIALLLAGIALILFVKRNRRA